MKHNQTLTIAALLLVPLLAFSQVRLHKPQHFSKQLPAGNYSGIAPLGSDRYAVVSDKSVEDGFFIFRLRIDTLKGKILEASNEGFYSCGLKNRDMEAVVFRPSTNTLFISGETDNEVFEYALNGRRTGKRLQMPDCFKQASRNVGLESLAYDTLAHRFYTTSEHTLKGDSLLRIQSFDDQLRPQRQYLYCPDGPISQKYFHGVAELCATGNGKLLILERQIRVPRLKIGAKTIIRIYEVTPSEDVFLTKTLVTEFKTRINLFSRRFANYEGLCMPFNGWLLLVADSQDQSHGLLRDWFRLISIPNERKLRMRTSIGLYMQQRNRLNYLKL